MQNIFNQGSMQEFATYVAIIRTIATQIRELQYQNGMSEHEVDLYLIRLFLAAKLSKLIA